MKKTYIVRQGEFDDISVTHPIYTRGTFYSLSDARKFYEQIKNDTSWSNSDFVYTEIIRLCKNEPQLQFDYFLTRVQ